eukprot:m.45232 g.45232  ORF g.45232 m.45232 type:complete len:71 (+) comp11765_c0_seq2:249-461(+)
MGNPCLETFATGSSHTLRQHQTQQRSLPRASVGIPLERQAAPLLLLIRASHVRINKQRSVKNLPSTLSAC